MDPNELLRLLRLTIKQMRVDTDPAIKLAHAEEIAEYVENLDEWLSRDGFLPADWESDDDKDRMAELLRDAVGDACESHAEFEPTCSTCVAVSLLNGREVRR